MVDIYRLVPELYARMAVSTFRRAFPPAAGTVKVKAAPARRARREVCADGERPRVRGLAHVR